MEQLKFFPAHPSDEKTSILEFNPSPLLPQTAPVDCARLHSQFETDFDAVYPVYLDKRFEITGIAKEVGPDMHNKPAIWLSDAVGGTCHALCIFPDDSFYSNVQPGDTVTISGNYLVYSNWFGVVMKFCELA